MYISTEAEHFSYEFTFSEGFKSWLGSFQLYNENFILQQLSTTIKKFLRDKD